MRQVSSSHCELRLTLLAAGVASRRLAAVEQARGLAERVDWGMLAERLRSRRLLSTLGPNVLELVEGAHTDAFAEDVRAATEAARRQGGFLQLVADHARSTLLHAGIACAPLKGPHLAEAIYGDLGRRLSNDVDLLVAPEHLQAAVSVVRELGYEAPRDHIERNGLPRLHYSLQHSKGALPSVELHWRVHWYEQSFARERLLLAGPHGRPAPADELAALLLFYARDGFVGLRLASDLSAWWDRFGSALEDSSLRPIMQAYPALERALRGAATAAERTVGLPAGLVVGEVPPLGVRARAAVRLADPNPGSSASQLYAGMGLIDGLLAPPRGLAGFVRRQLLVPRDVLDQRAGRTGDRSTRSPFMYALRLFVRWGVLARYGLALARIARPRMAHA